MPNAATLRSLNIDITKLWENIRDMREQVSSQEKEESAAQRLQRPLKTNSCILCHRRGAKLDPNKRIGEHPTLFEPLLE
jgi:succinate dehydrogenase/fumarate reductase-like Fe-S protein